MPSRLWILVGLFCCCLSWSAGAQEPAAADSPATPAEFTVEQLAERVRESVVVITVPDRDGKDEQLGTGFVVSQQEGLIATNLHVVGEGRPVSVLTADRRTLEVISVHSFDRELDLAVLRVKLEGKPLPELELADSDQIRDGTTVVVMGNPLGLRHSVVSGVVSGRREIEGRQMLQLAMPIEPGNSGGPVVDLRGRVHGVVTLKMLNTNLGFAVTSNLLRPLLDSPNPVSMERWRNAWQVNPAQWSTLFGARWSQRGGQILVEGAGGGFGGRALCLAVGGPPDTPYELAVTVKLEDESGAAGLAFHSDGNEQHYGFYPTNGRMRLSRFEGPDVYSWKVLTEVPTTSYRPGQWNELKVRVEKDKLLCYVNHELVIESTDQHFVAGRVGLAKFRDTKAQFKQFRVGREILSPQSSPEESERLQKVLVELPPLESLQPGALAPLVEAGPAAVGMIQDRLRQLEEQAARLRRLADDVHTQAVAGQLGALVRENAGEFDLLRGALLIARLDEPDLETDGYIAQVDRMGTEIQQQLPAGADEPTRLAALNRYLFQENGFHGSRFEYYHRANSYMHRVIDDRVGLPITLSVLYMELGRRIGLKIEGIALPGHFVVKHEPAAGEVQLLDVFAGAKVMTREAAVQLIQQSTDQPWTDEELQQAAESSLEGASKTAILSRILMNLRRLAEQSGDDPALLRYLDALVAIDPEDVESRGLRSLIRFRNGYRDAAISDLNWFLEHEPAGLDLDRIREMREHFERPAR